MRTAPPFASSAPYTRRGDARLNHGAGAHGARFDGDVKRGVGEAIVADGFCGGAQGHDFGVGTRIAIADGAISGARDHAIIGDDYRADRNFAVGGGIAGFFESERHPSGVGGGCLDHGSKG